LVFGKIQTDLADPSSKRFAWLTDDSMAIHEEPVNLANKFLVIDGAAAVHTANLAVVKHTDRLMGVFDFKEASHLIFAIDPTNAEYGGVQLHQWKGLAMKIGDGDTRGLLAIQWIEALQIFRMVLREDANLGYNYIWDFKRHPFGAVTCAPICDFSTHEWVNGVCKPLTCKALDEDGVCKECWGKWDMIVFSRSPVASYYSEGDEYDLIIDTPYALDPDDGICKFNCRFGYHVTQA
jgi:hypothetical protein